LRPEDCFSPDYATARARFRAAAEAARAERTSLSLAARGPDGSALTIDIAWCGAPSARRVLLHTSGLHGVEAFAGSAVQVAALLEARALPPGCALALVHVLNPYGMAWLRRANENNVDLNRNFMQKGEPDGHSRAPMLYDQLDALLNPPSPPTSDFFALRLLWRAARHGARRLQQAIAEGQYRYPRGLFFGGSELEPGPASYLDWLGRHLPQADYIMALDIHTGLGKRGRSLLMTEPGVGATPEHALSAALGQPVAALATDASRPYRVTGSMGAALPRVLPRARIDFVLQEIGTYGPLSVLAALRDENRWHHHGSGGLEHPAKHALLEALCPRSPAWRAQALGQGLAVLRAAAAWTFGTSSCGVKT
jgi:hypothetical protein